MNWKDTIVGSLATLAVTVVASVIVYYVTKEPVNKPVEDLYYTVKGASQFSGDKQKISFSTMDVGNSGEVPASNVVATIKFSAGAVQDIAIDAPQGPRVEQEIHGNEVLLKFPKLLPREVVTVNFLITGPSKPVVTLRSDDSFGKAKAWAPAIDSSDTRSAKFNRASGNIVPISVAIFALVVFWAYKKYKKSKIRYTDGMVADKNNAAFTLLHSALVSDAANILSASIRQGRYDAFTLSNLALCEKLTGDGEKARRLLDAANFGGQSRHAEAVVAFNMAIISFLDDDVSKFSKHLSRAYSLSKAEIKGYVDRSVHFKEFRVNPNVDKIIIDIEGLAFAKA
ncbi:tetratricopeptide repeat protein [Xanthomonas sp. PPL139]|uniref:tetratricopeptide repeat protein n=1 Tax=unclassified Xanthomonas TaxID=2643310 RepID=UPI0033BE9D95